MPAISLARAIAAASADLVAASAACMATFAARWAACTAARTAADPDMFTKADNHVRRGGRRSQQNSIHTLHSNSYHGTWYMVRITRPRTLHCSPEHAVPTTYCRSLTPQHEESSPFALLSAYETMLSQISRCALGIRPQAAGGNKRTDHATTSTCTCTRHLTCVCGVHVDVHVPCALTCACTCACITTGYWYMHYSCADKPAVQYPTSASACALSDERGTSEGRLGFICAVQGLAGC